MSRKVRGVALAAMLVALLEAACGKGAVSSPTSPRPTRVSTEVRTMKDRPPLAMIEREGDPRSAIAVAVMTGGVAPERGAEVAVALSALIEARLAAKGYEEVSVSFGLEGYRVRMLIGSDEQAKDAALALRDALVASVNESEAEILAHVKKKAGALRRRPLPDAALLQAVRCTGEAYALPGAPPVDPSTADLEAWRAVTSTQARVAFAAVGTPAFVARVEDALEHAPTWREGEKPPAEPWPAADARPEVYDATGAIAGGSARVTVAVHTASASSAVAIAPSLGDPTGPLASRLGALDGPAKVRSVTATGHSAGGCLAVTLDLSARDLGGDVAGRIATATTLARQELAVELGDTDIDPAETRALVMTASDPRDAAERAAFWTLVGDRHGVGAKELRFSVAVGLASGRDTPSDEGFASRVSAIKSDVDRATVAWSAPVVEARTRIERGQGKLWLLLASPCGTSAEVEGDAGLGAAVAFATATRAMRMRASSDLEVEPWVTPEGVGLLVHASALPGETPAAHARRAADVAARSFAAEPLDTSLVGSARSKLVAHASEQDARALGTLGAALTPGHPSWTIPWGTVDGLGRASDEAVALRALALRGGPLRVAVLANVDASQSQAAVHAVDRWIARRPGEARACPPPSTPPPPRPGTYAVEIAGSGTSEAILAQPLPAGDEARANAAVVAAMLDGPEGLLAHAVGDGGLARAWSAKVLTTASGSALVVRVSGANGALDNAVAQTRALLERLRQGAITSADHARAVSAIARDELATGLDPRARLVALWRAAKASPPPPLEAVRAFAAATLRDEARIIVAARPPRVAR